MTLPDMHTPDFSNWEKATTQELAHEVKQLRLFVGLLYGSMKQFVANGEVPATLAQRIDHIEAIALDSKAMAKSALETNEQKLDRLFSAIASIQSRLDKIEERL